MDGGAFAGRWRIRRGVPQTRNVELARRLLLVSTASFTPALRFSDAMFTLEAWVATEVPR